METGGDATDTARALADVDAIRRRVINVVGHALRTPITTMAGMTSALANAPDDETRALLIEGLARNGKRVEALLDDLLIAAGVSTAVPVDAAEPVMVADALNSAWGGVGGAGRLHTDGPAVSIVVRPGLLDRILRALLDNAFKYGHGTVAARVDIADDVVCIAIESMGDGPSDDELLHVFELLYRGEHAVTAAPGLGIGLPVARQLARAEGGDVTFERRGDLMVATVVLPR